MRRFVSLDSLPLIQQCKIHQQVQWTLDTTTVFVPKDVPRLRKGVMFLLILVYSLIQILANSTDPDLIRVCTVCQCPKCSHPSFTDTVDSRYLEFQGTLWNTSRYPYLDISVLLNWGKIIRTTTLNKDMCSWTPEVRDISKKYCGKEEKLLLRSNFSSFLQYCFTCC